LRGFEQVDALSMGLPAGSYTLLLPHARLAPIASVTTSGKYNSMSSVSVHAYWPLHGNR
jgi:hypothetical protein